MLVLQNQTLGQWIQEKRGNRKAIALAEEAGISPQMWSDLENDRSRRKDGLPARPTIETCQKLARVLGVTVDDVLHHAGYPSGGNSDSAFREEYETNPEGEADDPLRMAYDALYGGVPPELRPDLVGVVARYVRDHQRSETTHGKKALTEDEE